MEPIEAIYGFVAWLTTRDKTTKLGAKDNAAPVCELIEAFRKTNNLAEPRDNYTDFFEMPKEEK